MENKDRIICALDVTDTAAARRLVEQLDGLVDFFKVGMIPFLAGGPDIISWLTARKKKVFLDLKFYDVPDTVAGVVAQAAAMGVTFITIHGNRDIICRAAEAASGSPLQLLAVTVLTSLDGNDLQEMGFPCSVDDLVIRRAGYALQCGCAGVVASAREAALIRSHLGPELIIVTPGIRPRGADTGTHKRAVTPAQALRNGADYLVVGQPIIRSPDPRRAATAILDEMGEGMGPV